MGYFALFLLLGLGLIYLHRHHDFLQNFWVPAEHTENAGRIALVAGIISILISFIFYFNNMRLPFMFSLLLLAVLAGLIIGIVHLARDWLSGNAGERASHSWSLRSFWIPALIVLLVIILVLSHC